MMHRRFLIWLLTFIGCTYSFNPSVYSHIKSIAVPPLKNETVKYGLAESFTQKLVQAFMEDGSLKIRDAKKADSVLRGRIITYEKLPFIYDEYEQVSSFKVIIGIEVQFEDRIRDRDLWNKKFEDWGSYPADGEEDQGIQEAMEKLGDRLIREIVEGW